MVDGFGDIRRTRGLVNAIYNGLINVSYTRRVASTRARAYREYRDPHRIHAPHVYFYALYADSDPSIPLPLPFRFFFFRRSLSRSATGVGDT